MRLEKWLGEADSEGLDTPRESRMQLRGNGELLQGQSDSTTDVTVTNPAKGRVAGQMERPHATTSSC